MALAFQSITLDAGIGDSAGMLVLRDGALLAIAAKLGDIQGELAGSWFIEAVFHSAITAPREPFPDLAALDAWLSGQVAEPIEDRAKRH